MKNTNIKNIAVIVIFSLFVFGFFVACLFHSPEKFSESERRDLAQFPDINLDSVLDKTAIQGFDKYSADQFPLRETLLDVYRWYRLNLVKPKAVQSVVDSVVKPSTPDKPKVNVNIVNDYAEAEGWLAKVNTSLNVDFTLEQINQIYDRYLKGSGGKVYYSVIPMKDYFFAEKYGTLSLDYGKLFEKLENGLPSEFSYIDIMGLLALEDYYRTDTHWSQDKILDVRDKLLLAIGGADEIKGDYTTEKFESFEGVYYSNAPVKGVEPDTLYYLTNDILNALKVYEIEVKTDKVGNVVEVVETLDQNGVYNLNAFVKHENKAFEPYDAFLGGVRNFLRIENPNATTDKEIIVFRDSFGASIGPLLAEGYSKIYLIDLRGSIIESRTETFGSNTFTIPGLDAFGDKLDFENKDVLFLYCAEMLNSRAMFNANEK